MTEAEWLAATHPVPMLEFLRGRVSERKLRFAVTCCRRNWSVIGYCNQKLADLTYPVDSEDNPDLTAAPATEPQMQAAILRHIIGNPFHPYPAPSSWPPTILQLAHSLDNGDDCRLPLSDVLGELGHLELAHHFRDEDSHPKGCFGVDIIFGKE